ncbi:lipopolysaccharide biosynthesis protein [Oleispirillum naphthae]|uniref:GumC family protein n=1 Tax=Oleispirillum naphthae TaxID=2838853 RepID=UPI00308242EA
MTSGSAAPRPTFTLRDGLSSAFFHRKVILVSLLLPVLLAALAAPSFPLLYTAEARLMVLFSREQSGAQDLMGVPSMISVDGLRATETEMGILRSSEVIQGMIGEIGAETLFPELKQRRFLGLLPPYPPETRRQHAIEMAQKRVRVDTPSNSNLVKVSFEHENREIALEAIRSLVDIYLDHRFKVFENVRSPYLLKEAERYLHDLHVTERRLSDLKSRYSMLDPKQETLLAVNQMDSIVQRSRQMAERRVAVRAEIDEAQKFLDELPQVVGSFTEKSNQTDNDQARNQRLALQLERDRLIERYQPDYPRIQEIDTQLKAIDTFIEKYQPEYETSRQVRNPAIEFLTNHLLTLRVEAEAVDRQVAELTEQKVRAQERMNDLLTVEPTIKDLERLYSVQEENYREYSRRAEAARLEEAAARSRSANVRVIEAAFALPSGHSMLPSLLAGGLFIGVLLAALCGLTAARGRQVMLTPGEVERRVGLPVLGTFDDAGPERSRQNSDEMIFLANRLRDIGEDGRRLSVIQVVAPSQTVGRHGLVRGLALEVAQGYGQKTLLLDLDETYSKHRENLIAPDAARLPLFAPEIAPAGGSEAPEVWETLQPNLYLTANAAASVFGDPRMDRPQIREVLDKLAAAFDLILIDVPPLNANRAGLRYAPLVDGSILVVRAETTRLATAQYVRDAILSVGGDMLGALVAGRRYYIPKGVLRWL